MKAVTLEVTGISSALYGLGLSYGKTKAVEYDDFSLTEEMIRDNPQLNTSNDSSFGLINAMIARANTNCSMDKGHNKFLESIVVQVLITAPRMWWQEFDTYRLCTKQSDSTMHTLVGDAKNIASVMEEQILINTESLRPEHMVEYRYHIKQLLHIYNMVQLYCDGVNASTMTKTVKKQLLKHAVVETFPNTRQVCLDYKSLRNIYQQRKNHELPHWQYLCSWMESLPYSQWITGVVNEANN